MNPSQIKPAPGSRHRAKRVGRGPSSGLGKTCGRGHKGQKARKSGNPRRGFEGGQMPMHRRLPKRGFRSLDKKVYAVINLKDIERVSDVSDITPEVLIERRVVRELRDGIKLLGTGEVTRALKVKLHAVSGSARDKITAAGGSVEVI